MFSNKTLSSDYYYVDFTLAQVIYSTINHLKNSVLGQNIELVVLLSRLFTNTNIISILKRVKKGVLRWNIELLLPSSPMYTNIHRTSHRNLPKKDVLQWIIQVVLLLSPLYTNINRTFHRKKPTNLCYAMESRDCVTIYSSLY